MTTAPSFWTLVSRQRDYWWTVYKRTWRGSVFFSFLNPLLYLTAMGVLLGRYVDASMTGGVGGAPSYLLFMAPGLLAGHVMQIAVGEVLWPVMGMVKWNKTYFSMIATPLRVIDIVGAHLGFAAFRVATTAAVFMLALIPFGAYASVPGAILAFVASVLVGVAFAAIFFVAGASARSDSVFSSLLRVVVMPLFLFSGAFFPIANLPVVVQWVAYLTPLWHGVELTRTFMLADLGSLDAGAWGMVAVHVAYLVVLTAVGAVWSVRALTRRLIS